MLTTKPISACLGLAIALSGCSGTLVSDNRLRANTAGVLGEPESAVAITDVRGDVLANTYYIAHTPRGVFACSIGGGALTLGLVNPPVCNRT
ncbi:MAG TPA: hypothetical protein VKI44_35160 [Acetobacteraceae bacterium]|nr:hypothetical protein [Acetobacteraceae bacterium]